MYKEIECDSWWANLFIVGDYETILRCCRESCYPKGLCVTIEKCDYVYAGGMENGFRIGFIQYPKYQEDINDIFQKAVELGKLICEKNYQWSFTVQARDKTRYFSRREHEQA